jgi:hypothetical protein
MDTFVLPAGSVTASTREAWERSRLVMSLLDGRAGEVVVGAADDKAADLRDAVREVALEPVRSLGRCCWLSVVGEFGALAEQHQRWMLRFAQDHLPVHAAERTDRRHTYVLPESARERAAAILHETIDHPA